MKRETKLKTEISQKVLTLPLKGKETPIDGAVINTIGTRKESSRVRLEIPPTVGPVDSMYCKS